MKFVFPVALVCIILAIGCKRTTETPCESKSVESETPAMTKFATDSSINVTSDASGILYQIITPGTGATPTANSTVTAKYTGRFLNGTQFDASSNATFPLNGVIRGWQIAIPKIKAGGRIKMIIPSTLAYDCSPYYPQMQNKPLYFDVELISVQ